MWQVLISACLWKEVKWNEIEGEKKNKKTIS